MKFLVMSNYTQGDKKLIADKNLTSKTPGVEIHDNFALRTLIKNERDGVHYKIESNK